MKKLLMLLGILALSTGMVVAQDTAQDQPAPPEQQNQEQPAEQPAETDADANVDVDVNQDAQDPAAADAEALPQTASPLPLIALLGLGSLAAGLVSRKK